MSMSTTESREALVVDHITAGPFATNLYVAGCSATGAGVIVDAGADAPALLAMVRRHNFDLEAVWLTHAHIDHIGALSGVRKAASEVPIMLHPDEKELYQGASQQAVFFGLPPLDPPPIDAWFQEGQQLTLGELKAEVLLLPGHSPGSVAFYFREQGVLFGGDVLFAGSIGRTDLPGSDPRAMKHSLEVIAALPEDTRVLPGHGPETTIGRERESNPFLKAVRS